MPPAYGKNTRGAKRGGGSPAAGASPCLSNISLALFVGLCLFGVYMLSSSRLGNSSTSVNSHHPHKRNSVTMPRAVLRDPLLEFGNDRDGTALDDMTLPEHAVRGDDGMMVVLPQERRQQDDEVETRPTGGDDDSQEQSEDQQNQNEDQQQEQHDEQSNEEQQNDEQSNEEQQQQSENNENGNDGNTENQEDQQQQQEEQLQQQEEEQQQDEQQEQAEEQLRRRQQEEEQQQNEQQQDEQQQQRQQQEEEEQQQDEQQQQQQQEDQQQEEEQQEEEQPQQEEQQQEDQQQQEQQQQEQEEEQQQHEEQHQQQEERQNTSQQSEEEQQHQQEEERQQHQQRQQRRGEEDSEDANQQSEENPNASESIMDDTSSKESKGDMKTWATQADQSSNEKERRKEKEPQAASNEQQEGKQSRGGKQEWELCNVTAGPDYIPCLDNEKAIKKLHSLRHYEHRERHCPEESPTCLVPLPASYKRSIPWPQSRDRIWYSNVPHTKLAEVKGHQNWVKVAGEYLTFPGGGTQFIHGALHYIDFIQKSVPEIAWGKHTRVILDVGCGVASFGGYLFERDVLAMSFAPKDEHEAQVQFALERGIPAISAVMGSQRLPFPSRVFDVVHCARCRVPWHANDGALLLELNRVLRPGGFFVWSATPVYQKLKEDVEIWEAMTALTKSMCWELSTIKRDELNLVGAAMYRKPTSNDCYQKREQQSPPMCKEDDDPNAAWYVPLESCMHPVPVNPTERGSHWPQEWPARVRTPPYWLNNTQMGIYGKPAPEDFAADYEHWKRVVEKSYLTGFGITWSKIRNVMDMRAVYGGFAAALRDMKVWVMNLVNVDAPDTLPIIYERGLFGMYHDWCESFSTYPRTYDLLHADHLLSQVKKRCKILPVIAEVDRIVRPGGKIIVRDESETVSEVEDLLKSLHWEIRLTFSKNGVGILCAEKSDWRPEKFAAYS